MGIKRLNLVMVCWCSWIKDEDATLVWNRCINMKGTCAIAMHMDKIGREWIVTAKVALITLISYNFLFLVFFIRLSNRLLFFFSFSVLYPVLSLTLLSSLSPNLLDLSLPALVALISLAAAFARSPLLWPSSPLCHIDNIYVHKNVHTKPIQPEICTHTLN